MAGSLLPRLKKLYADTVTLAPITSDALGAPTLGAAVTYKARVMGQHKVVRDSSGEETMSTVQVWIYGTPTIDHTYILTLPARFSPRTPPIITVENQSDENGAHHVKIYCK